MPSRHEELQVTGAFTLPEGTLSQLSPKSRACIERLQMYTTLSTNYPLKKLAAVLILLYEREERLRVLLTTRSKRLRAHPGQTALPGGMVEDEDRSYVETAFREAKEEVLLPINSPAIHGICILPPFLSAYKHVVTPIVALLTDSSVLDGLVPRASEVDGIFDHPLEAMLHPQLMQSEDLNERGLKEWKYGSEYHQYEDVEWIEWTYRLHEFRSCATPVTGLTADILILAAEIAYGEKPSYERFADRQATFETMITKILENMVQVNPAT